MANARLHAGNQYRAVSVDLAVKPRAVTEIEPWLTLPDEDRVREARWRRLEELGW